MLCRQRKLNPMALGRPARTRRESVLRIPEGPPEPTESGFGLPVSRFAIPQSIVFMQMSVIWRETSFLQLLFLVWLSSIHAVVFENGIFESGDFFRAEQRSNRG